MFCPQFAHKIFVSTDLRSLCGTFGFTDRDDLIIFKVTECFKFAYCILTHRICDVDVGFKGGSCVRVSEVQILL